MYWVYRIYCYVNYILSGRSCGLHIINKNIINIIIKANRMRGAQNERRKQALASLSNSTYSILYQNYMLQQFASVELLIKNFVRMQACRQVYLKYPLQCMLRGICRRLLLNVYQFLVFAYFLVQTDWQLNASFLISPLPDLFPNILHVNEPTDPQRLKELSMFFYLSSYSIKDFLNSNIDEFRLQMVKLFPQFEGLHGHWSNLQQTVGQILNPRVLNALYKTITNTHSLADLNLVVDRVLQISPCYDITTRNKTTNLPHFGYYPQSSDHQAQAQLKIEDNFQAYHFEGDI